MQNNMLDNMMYDMSDKMPNKMFDYISDNLLILVITVYLGTIVANIFNFVYGMN